MDTNKHKPSALSLDDLHREVSTFVTALEKKIPPGVNDQTIRDHLSWIKKNLSLLSEATIENKTKLRGP